MYMYKLNRQLIYERKCGATLLKHYLLQKCDVLCAELCI